MDNRRLKIKARQRKRKRRIIGMVSCILLVFGTGIVLWFVMGDNKDWSKLFTQREKTEITEQTEEVTEMTTEEITEEIIDYTIFSGESKVIDKGFAMWLYDNYNEAFSYAAEKEQSGEYEDRLWYEQTGKSIYILQDEYLGRLDTPEIMAENLIYEKECSSLDYVSISFAGDISFASDYLPGQNYNSYGMDGAFSKDVQMSMKTPDIFMLNNEFAYTNGGNPQYAKGYIFRAEPEKAERLSDMGVDIVSVANNHAYDYGADGFLDTMDALNDANIPYVGGGSNLSDAKNHIVYFIANGMKIGYIAATQVERDLPIYTQPATEDNAGVVRCYDGELVNEMIRTAKENCDFVIVYPHWGTELVNEIQDDQRALAQSFIDNGADLVIGSHAHVLQGAEYYNGVPIFYGLSNFSFSSRVRESCIVNLKINMDGIKTIQFIPCMESAGITIQCDKGDTNYNHILELMNAYSPNIHFDEDGYVTKVGDE